MVIQAQLQQDLEEVEVQIHTGIMEQHQVEEVVVVILEVGVVEH